MAEHQDPAVGFHFNVEVDGHDIGSFTACEGLGAEYELFEYQEGGENGYVHRIPGRLKYTPIKLTRALDGHSDRRGKGLAAWFTQMKGALTASPDPGSSMRASAIITARDVHGKTIAEWHLVDVYPSRWTGPSMAADGNSVLKETLELAHNGFAS